MPRKGKRSKAEMSQRVKQNQTVKINIKNLLPQTRQRGDYIQPRRGMPMDNNLNMGNVTRLEAPSIRYAVRPPEFLPLPERINSQGQPQYFTAAPSRQGRPDLIYQETNPSDIEPRHPSIRAVASAPVPSPQTPARKASAFAGLPPVSGDMNPFAPAESVQPIQMIPAIDSPQMDESQRIVAAQVRRGRPPLAPGEKGKTKERLQYGPFIPHQFQQGREQAASAAMTGVPPVPSSGFIKTPSRTIQDDEEKDEVSTSTGYKRPPPSRTIQDDEEDEYQP